MMKQDTLYNNFNFLRLLAALQVVYKHNDFIYGIHIYHMLVVNLMVELKLVGGVKPYDGFISFMNIINDLRYRVKNYFFIFFFNKPAGSFCCYFLILIILITNPTTT